MDCNKGMAEEIQMEIDEGIRMDMDEVLTDGQEADCHIERE